MDFISRSNSTHLLRAINSNSCKALLVVWLLLDNRFKSLRTGKYVRRLFLVFVVRFSTRFGPLALSFSHLGRGSDMILFHVISTVDYLSASLQSKVLDDLYFREWTTRVESTVMQRNQSLMQFVPHFKANDQWWAITIRSVAGQNGRAHAEGLREDSKERGNELRVLSLCSRNYWPLYADVWLFLNETDSWHDVRGRFTGVEGEAVDRDFCCFITPWWSEMIFSGVHRGFSDRF